MSDYIYYAVYCLIWLFIIAAAALQNHEACKPAEKDTAVGNRIDKVA